MPIEISTFKAVLTVMIPCIGAVLLFAFAASQLKQSEKGL